MRGLAPMLITLSVLAPACTLVETYPSDAIESSAAACHNRLDDDFDGQVDCHDRDCAAYCGEGTYALCRNGADDDQSGAADCEDPTCAGLCAEESVAACTDHVDQDGDGLVDLGDPSCWPAAHTTLERCVNTPGVDFTATFDTGNDGWSAEGGALVFRADPTGRYTHSVLVIPDGPPPGAIARVVSSTLVTGAIDGLTLDASIYLPRNGGVFIHATSPTTPPPHAPAEITVVVDAGSLEAWMVVDGAPLDTFRGEMHPPGWYDMHFAESGTAYDVTLTSADGSFHSSLHVGHAHDLSAASALQLAFSQSTGSTGALVGGASIRRLDYQPCPGVTVPAADPSLDAASRHVLAAASNGSALCVMNLAATHDIDAFRSDDGGRTFGAGMRVATGGSSSEPQNPCLTLAWDAERALFAGIAWHFGSMGIAQAVAVTSPDCHTWTADDVPNLATSEVGCARYSIVPSAGGAATHELWKSSAVSPTHVSLVRAWSPTPFGPDTMPTIDPPLEVDLLSDSSAAGREAIYAFAGDLLVTTGLEGEMHGYVVHRALGLARDWLVAGPSRYEGSCDALTLAFPTVFFDDAPRGGLAYTCAQADYFSGGPTAVQTFDVAFPPR